MSVCYSALKYDEIIRDHKPIEIKRFHGFIHPIQEFLNTNIDLDSVSRITNAYHVDKMGYGGHFVAFDIISQKNEPIFEFMCEVGTKHAKVPKEEYEHSGGNYPYSKIGENYYKSVYPIQETVDAIQEKIVDDIVKVWCLYKEQEKGWGDLDENSSKKKIQKKENTIIHKENNTVMHREENWKNTIQNYKPIEIKKFHGFIHPVQKFLNIRIDIDHIFSITDASSLHTNDEHLVCFDVIGQDNEPVFEFIRKITSELVEISKEEYEKLKEDPLQTTCHSYGTQAKKYYKNVYPIQETVDAIQEKIVDDLVRVWCLYKEQEKGWGDLDEKTK